jgi:hypothetical protein
MIYGGSLVAGMFLVASEYLVGNVCGEVLKLHISGLTTGRDLDIRAGLATFEDGCRGGCNM